MEMWWELFLENLEPYCRTFKRNLDFVTLIHKMTKYNNLIQNLLDSHLYELKLTTKNVSGMTLILSSNFRNET